MWSAAISKGRSALLAAVAVVAAAACGSAAHGPGGSAGSAVPTSSGSSSAAIERPSCVGPHEGVYLEQPAGPGINIPVLILGKGPRGVVVGAQANGDICDTVDFARELAGHGYHVAIFDWEQPYSDAMAAATTALANAGALKIVVGGFSRGAVIGLGAAHQLGPRVVGVMAVSGGPSESEGYPTLRSESTFPGPILLICSRDDWVFPKGTCPAIAALHKGPQVLLMLAGSDHAIVLLEDEHAGEVRAAIYRFLAQVTK